MDASTTLPEALEVIQRAKDKIKEIEEQLPMSSTPNFRERLVAHIEQLQKLEKLATADLEFQEKARELLLLYEDDFGVKDVVDSHESL